MKGIINYYNIMGNENNNGDIGGGIIENITIGGTDYTIHIFNESSSFYNNIPLEIEYLVVAGGGGASAGGLFANASAGGGAGGLKHTFGSPINLPVGSYDMIIGKGGVRLNNGIRGGNSVFANGSTFSNIVYGGGTGNNILNNGGSGAGGLRYMNDNATALSTLQPGTGISGQGNNGGYGWGTLLTQLPDGTYHYHISGGAGGGGAGGVGGSANSTSGGDGGVGIDLSSYLTTNYGDSGYFAGGGAGRTHNTSTGAIYTGTSIGVGANTGGGGTKGRNSNGAGDDGIIIIRYKTPE